jgi:hypothetical protein
MPAQPHPSWFDWITVAAILIGPVFALFAQRLLDWMREKKQRKVQVYVTAMSMRGTWLNPESLRALNSIDTIFVKKIDRPVREAWANVIAHVNTKPPDWRTQPDELRDWNNRLLDRRVDLYQALGAAVGYDHTIDYIKTGLYIPQSLVDAEIEQTQIRKQFAKAITDNGLKVVIHNAE